MDINARLDKLERENRRMKKIGVVAAVVVSAFIVGGQAKSTRIVEANQFRLVDASGKLRARLSMEMTNRPTLSFYDGNAITASFGGGDEPFLILNRPGTSGSVQIGANRGFYGIGIYEKEIRAGLSVQKGIPGLELYDEDGIPLATIEATETGSITLLGKDNKVLWSAP